ncbi:MAG: DUF4349 domain-containing protein [Oscillospiraceae bacterium]|nr:DUF4349 domain-containing protein [Oscillospiraceae bacterium]
MKNLKKYKNLFGFLVLALACAILSGGCSSAYDSFNYGKSADYANSSPESGGNLLRAYDAFEAEGEAAEEVFALLSAADSGTAANNLPADRKIIRDASVTMEAEEVEPSYENILALLSNLGGYEADRSMYSNSYGYPVINSTLKVPAGKLDSFLAEIKKEGEIVSSNISSSDISDKYFDARIRLETLEKTLENYYRFLESAESVEEQLEVTRYINDTTYEIEQLKGSLRRWDSLIDYSTVTFYLYPVNEAPEEPRVIEWDSLSLDDMGWFISSGFLGVCNAIFSVLQWVVISILAISPILIALAVLIFLLVRRHKKTKAKKLLQWQQAQAQAQIYNPPENNGNMPQ